MSRKGDRHALFVGGEFSVSGAAARLVSDDQIRTETGVKPQQ
jgi:hypothetical protein